MQVGVKQNQKSGPHEGGPLDIELAKYLNEEKKQ